MQKTITEENNKHTIYIYICIDKNVKQFEKKLTNTHTNKQKKHTQTKPTNQTKIIKITNKHKLTHKHRPNLENNKLKLKFNQQQTKLQAKRNTTFRTNKHTETNQTTTIKHFKTN